MLISKNTENTEVKRSTLRISLELVKNKKREKKKMLPLRPCPFLAYFMMHALLLEKKRAWVL